MPNEKIISRGSFKDKINDYVVNGEKVKGFFVEEGEIRELPDNWKESPSIVNALKTGFFKFVSPSLPEQKGVHFKKREQIVKRQIEEPEAEISDLPDKIEKEKTTADKVVDDYLNRNTKTVRKAIRTDNLDKSFLKKLEAVENKEKKRNSILDTIRRKLRGE